MTWVRRTLREFVHEWRQTWLESASSLERALLVGLAPIWAVAFLIEAAMVDLEV